MKSKKRKKQKHNVQKRLSEIRIKLGKSRQEHMKMQVQAEEQIRPLEEEVANLHTRISQLEQINVLLEKDEIKTFENGRYTVELRQVCMELLTSHHVSIRQLPSVITSVIQGLTGKLPSRLPSLGYLSDRIMMEAKIVAMKQSAITMLQDLAPESGKGHTGQHDATSKWHNHYEGIQVNLFLIFPIFLHIVPSINSASYGI